MSEYHLELKQIVDYPRCRIYREFIQSLIADRNIRTNGSSGLFHYTVLCCYANFRTSYRRLDGISYTVYPGEWICRIPELMEHLRLRTRCGVLQVLDRLQEQGYIQYSLLGRGHLIKYRIKGWRRHNTVLDYNCPCQKETGFFFLPISIANELISMKRCSEMDINATLEDLSCPGHYRQMPVLGDLYETLMESPETRRIANILNRLVHGSASTFNQQTNVSLENKYTVLDISELTGDLLTAGMFVALDFVWDKIKEDRTKEKAVFIDECWQLIGASSNRQAAEFVLEIFKTIRGYGGSAICATQDLNDFFALDDGKYGKGIINVSKTKIILNLEEEEAHRVQSTLHLSEAEIMEVTHFERGNALISTNNNNIAVEIKCSQMEKELITTDRRELQELLDRAETQKTS